MTIYKSNQCEVCKQAVPVIKKLAKKKGYKVRVVDVDKCHTKQCDDIKAVPEIRVDDRAVSPTELAKLLK